MSLFKVREFWSTISEDDEYFDQNSLIVSKLNSDFDYVITGSQSGVLRIFKPNCDVGEKEERFHPNDVVVEKILDYPILQVAVGRLISGNSETQMAVLHPKSLCVYALVQKNDNQTFLQLAHEYKLRRSAACCSVGPFGSSPNRDFICVQSLDGTLSFLEQEGHRLSHVTVPDFLLPGPIAYIPATDCFLLANSNWEIDVYVYKSLSEAAEDDSSSAAVDPIYSKPRILPDWSFNLGEAIVEVEVISDLVNKETWIVLMGERNLFCLTASGRLHFMKKLDYAPVCMTAYLIDSNIYCLVVAETGMLLIYENTTLKWSAQLNYLPIAMRRACFASIKGALVMLGDEGRLECCYLGTEPSFFVAPPLNVPEIDFARAEEELVNLERVLSSHSGSGVAAQNDIEKDILINMSVDASIQICTYEHNISRNAANNYMCSIKVDLVPKCTFQEVQVALSVHRPLKVTPAIHFFSHLNEKATAHSCGFLDEAQDVPSLCIEAKISLITNLGVPRSITKRAMLPLPLVLQPNVPEKENKHKLTLNVASAPPSFGHLFPEYDFDQSCASSGNAIGLRSASGSVVTILLAKSADKYRIQADNFTILSLTLEQLVYRLQSHGKAAYNSTMPLSELFSCINEHFTSKRTLNELQDKVSQLSAQFRLIQKRLITKYRAKSPTSLRSLELLLNDTYRDILENNELLEKQQEYLAVSQINLACGLNVAKQLIRLGDIDSALLDLIDSALCLRIYDLQTQAWEDVMDASLCYLLRTVMAKTEKDRLRAPHSSFDEIKDLSKLEKHLNQVLERVSKPIETSAFPDDDEPTTISETSQEKPIGSQYGEFSSRLLSARKSLIRRHKEQENT